MPASQGENNATQTGVPSSVPPVNPNPQPDPVATPPPQPAVPVVNEINTTDQPPAPLTSPTPQVPPEPVKKSSPVFVIALILLLIAIIALGGYVLWTKYLNNSNTNVNPSPVAVVTASPTSDPTMNWKTYTNSELGIFFKYPAGWEVFDGKFIDTTPLKPDKLIAIGNDGTDVFLLRTKIYKSDLTAQQWWNDVGSGKFNELVSGGDNSINPPKFVVSSSTIGGQDAVVAKGFVNASQIGDTILSIISYNGYIYMFEQSNNEDVEASSLVLSTFKFTSATPTVSPASSSSATVKP